MRKIFLRIALCIFMIFVMTGCDLLGDKEKESKAPAAKPDLIPLETTKKATESKVYEELTDEAIADMMLKILEYSSYNAEIENIFLDENYIKTASINDACTKIAKALDDSLPTLREFYQMTGKYEELKEVNSKVRKAIEISPNKYTGNDIFDFQNYIYHLKDFYSELDEAFDMFFEITGEDNNEKPTDTL